ncbi:MAG: acyl-CoA dehydrogenase family protein [Pseudomonadota bacterium]
MEPAKFERFKKEAFDFIWREFDPLEEKIESTGKIDYKEIFPKISSAKFWGLVVPEEYGGSGLSVAQYIQILSELSKIQGGIRVIIHVHNSSAHGLLAGTEEQRKVLLPKVATGELSVAFALTEPDGGTGKDIKTKATKSGDKWILNGRKHLITNADFAKLFQVFCFTNPEMGERGISNLLVNHDAPGFRKEGMPSLMGCRGSNHGLLTFENCEVPVDSVLNKEGEGLNQALGQLETSRVFIASTSLGTSERCLDLSLEFAKKRSTFGKAIADRQTIQGYLADMATDIYALRTMIQDTAEKIDRGIPVPAEASMCKLFGLEAVGRVTDKALLIFGGIGYTKAYPIERLYRDARLNWLEEGPPTIQKMVIARNFLKEYPWRTSEASAVVDFPWCK